MSEHDCNCGPEGCSDDCNCGEHDDAVTVTLTLDNDEVIECVVLVIYEAGDKEYIALTPTSEDEDSKYAGEVFIYQFIDHEDDEEPELVNIESDEEYDVAADAFDEWLDSQDFEALDEE